MSFEVTPDAYDRFMGRYSAPLAPALCDLAGIAPGHRVLDVGCGPGAVIGELARRVGPGAIVAVDPSDSFVAAVRERYRGVDVRQGVAERLPFADGVFDAACAQLVVHFMEDPVAGLAEMRRVTRPGGVAVACVWDFEGERAPISVFWRAAQDLRLDAASESGLAGARDGQLAGLFAAAGFADVEATELSVSVTHQTFDKWWEPFALGVGPVGAYMATLDDAARSEIRGRCRDVLGAGPIRLTAAAWAARGRV